MAKRTYDQTFMIRREALKEAWFTLNVFEADKYTGNITDWKTVNYTGVTSWDMIEGGEEAAEIEADLNDLDCDEHHEYLVLHFDNGEQATFRNSHVDMWIDKTSRTF